MNFAPLWFVLGGMFSTFLWLVFSPRRAEKAAEQEASRKQCDERLGIVLALHSDWSKAGRPVELEPGLRWLSINYYDMQEDEFNRTVFRARQYLGPQFPKFVVQE